MEQLFWYKLLFMTELIFAELLFCFRLEKPKYFILRLSLSILGCYLLAVLYPLCFYTGWYASLMFLCMFLAGLFLLKISFKISWINSFFCVITAYTVQHLAYEIFNFVCTITGLGLGTGMYSNEILDLNNLTAYNYLIALIYLAIYLIIYWSSYLFLGRKLVKNGNIRLKNTHLLVFAGLILLVDIILNAFVVYINTDYNNIYNIIICIYNIVCCLLVFYIQMSLINEKEMKQEIETTLQLLHQAKQQYVITKENINLINLKCHDLKHQVKQYAAKGGIDKDSIEEIGKMIAIYDSTVETGNEVLDVILTEKSLTCQKEGIKMTCMANCSSLSFIKESDLYVIFGNAIDNAIEAVIHVKDPSKKCIGLTIHTVAGLVSININNYFEGKIKLDENDLPCTTKKDKNYHGFGLKSIKMLVEKYKGDISFVIEKGEIFNLNLFFPIPIKKD